jgi:hypothetical protein
VWTPAARAAIHLFHRLRLGIREGAGKLLIRIKDFKYNSTDECAG